MFSVFDIMNTIKDKLDEYDVQFTSEDLPDGGKQLGINYRGGTFKVRINDNKVSGANIDWSLVKNQTVTDELQRLLEGNLDKTVLRSSVYKSDDPTTNIIGSDESGKGDLFGGIVVAAAWVHPELAVQLKEEGTFKDSKKMDDRTCMGLVANLADGTNISKAERDGYTQYVISAYENKMIVSVVVASPMQYNQAVIAHGENPERALQDWHLMAIGDLTDELYGHKCTDVDDLVAAVDQFVPRFEESNLYDTVIEQAKEEGFKEFSIELREQAEDKVLAVAVASIFARVYFIKQIADMGLAMEKDIPLGSGKTARKFYEKNLEGLEDIELARVMKLKY